MQPHQPHKTIQSSTNGSWKYQPSLNLSVVTQFFPPDFAATGQLMEELVNYLAQQKIGVQVFTGQPGYAFNSSRAPRVEVKQEVRIQRSRVTKTRKFLGRTLSSLVFCTRAIFHLFKSSYRGDILLLTSEPPFLFIIGYITHLLFKTPYICLIYDLYPDVVVEFGIASETNWLIRFWNAANLIIWKRAKTIIVLSDTMRDRIINRYPRLADKIEIIHNWSDPNWIKPIPKTTNTFAQTHSLVNKFTVLYSGNMGLCHDMETIMSAAVELRHQPIQFIFIGSGQKRKSCIDIAEKEGLTNCLFLPYQDKELLPQSLTACDLSLVSVDLGMEGVVAPSKFYSALAAGRPIAVICEPHSYLRQLVGTANCGAAFEPGDSKGLASFISYLAKDDKLTARMGYSGNFYIQENFTLNKIGKLYLQIFEKAFFQGSDLKQGIKNQEFKLYYQPVISLRTGNICGFEVLLRWQHPLRGLLTPDEFLKIAEETGLIIPLGWWVIETACHQISQINKKYLKKTKLKINLSYKQFTHPDLIHHLEQGIQDNDLDSNQIVLDICEDFLIRDSSAASGILLRMREKKIQICVEKFGREFASINYLSRFSVNALEVDANLIRRLDFDSKSEDFIRSMLLLARDLDLDVMFEGIETIEQLNMLRSINAEYAKGTLFSPPMLPEEIVSISKNYLQDLGAISTSNLTPVSETHNPNNPLILVVDDDRSMRMLLRTVLSKEGFQVIEAESALEGIELNESLSPDLILLDSMMPGMNGFECCSEIKKSYSSMNSNSQKCPHIIMITSLEDNDSISRAFAAGATDYITKPVNWEILRQRLRLLLPIFS